jgi:LPXTG-motif cell wall-anchored protein
MQLIELDSTTAAGTLVGVGTPALAGADCGGQGAWNPVTKTAYAIAQHFDSGDDPVLVSIDLNTGVSTAIGPFLSGNVPVEVVAIAISPTGLAFAIGNSTLFTVSLSTGELTAIGPTQNNYTLAFDPTSGLLFTMDSSGGLFTVEPTDGTTTLVGSAPSGGTYSMTIDRSGIIWYVSDAGVGPGVYEGDLYSADPTDIANTEEFSGIVHVGAANPYTEALFIAWDIPGPQLAATGAPVESGVLAIAVLLLLGGVAAIVARRRRTV